MSFSGQEKIPCQCVKIVQVDNAYKISVYKELISSADVNKWDINISIKDDKTQLHVKPSEYVQSI